ncbi:MAG: flavodoxin family protein [bacterium]
MKVVVLTGSPHANGTTFVLAEQFIQGAQAKGHDIFRFDAAFKNIHPCQGCDACGMNGPCVQKDDIENELIMHLARADLIALISPVYYFHVTAQLKILIDRFYSRTGSISGKRSVLLAAAGSNTELTLRSLEKYYATLASYMRWQIEGKVLAAGCATREQILQTEFPKAAYELGYSL